MIACSLPTMMHGLSTGTTPNFPRRSNKIRSYKSTLKWTHSQRARLTFVHVCVDGRPAHNVWTFNQSLARINPFATRANQGLFQSRATNQAAGDGSHVKVTQGAPKSTVLVPFYPASCWHGASNETH
jgi:hypothetical protein